MRTGKASLKLFAGLLVVALIGAACGGDNEPSAGSTPKKTGAATTKAADVRALLNSLLSQHVFLAASATGAALGGRAAQFEAAKTAVLETNATQLADAVGSVYGAEARAAFLPLWQKHIGFVVDYTSNFGNKAKQDKAVADLLAYTEEFGAFIEGATEKILPKAAVADLVKNHILTLKAVIDAQQKKDFAAVYPALITAYDHMDMIAKGLASAIEQQGKI
jgi:hypothetical protein